MSEELIDPKQFNTAQEKRDAYECGLKDGAPKWVSVKERLPERSVYVLARGPDIVFSVGYRACNSEAWVYGDVTTFNVTHWAELPAPPKEEE